MTRRNAIDNRYNQPDFFRNSSVSDLERGVQEGSVIVPRRKTSKISHKQRELFYRLANEQEIIPGKLDDDNYPQVVELLSNVLKIRSINADGGKMPITNCEPKQVRAV